MAKRLTATALCLMALSMQAQKIDFNKGGRPESEGLEPGYTAWVVNEAPSATATFDGVTITLSCDADYAGETVMTNYWKQGVVTLGAKLVGDAVSAYKNDHANIAAGSVKVDVTVSGLAAGRHSVQAWHNNVDGHDAPPIDVYVDGVKRLEGVAQTNRETTPSASGQSFVEFDVAEGQAVVISYVSMPQDGTSYGSTTVSINALVFNEADSRRTASDPQPQNEDMHAQTDGGRVVLSWSGAPTAVLHHVLTGPDADHLQEVAVTADTCHELTGLTSDRVTCWRVDEEDDSGTIDRGTPWTFRPRRLAFPGAEGYGRFAIGGRGGQVYHVTSLDDDVQNPQAGTLRHGITRLTGPRTIVFDVGGVIHLKGRLTCADPCVTVAGQTAPGQGIMLRGAPFGMQSDGITRFVRMRLGYHNGDTDKGLDGLGMAGNDHAIMDHCSISWTIDEGFSSRNAKNITLQRTLISEALNIADHPNYESGKAHGFAATIGGGEMGGQGSSFHHNLLAHNEGRNWSISGGLDGNLHYDGHHDIFNNVCYNWGGRATDGGTHEGQFVANYYKMGPSTTQRFLLNAQIEGTGLGTQAYYVEGNMRENRDGTLTRDALGTTYKYTLSGGQQLDWTVFTDKPFFESHARVQTAEDAFVDVLCDVGCNQPFMDNHDVRMVKETLGGTTSTVGCRSGKKGLIDRETDAEGFDGLNITTTARPDGWDTDQDGLPDWFERLYGSDPEVANNNAINNADEYTDLEVYLDWMAHPHFMVRPQEDMTIDLGQLFMGCEGLEAVNVTVDTGDGVQAEADGERLHVWSMHEQLCTMHVTVRDAKTGREVTRQINMAISRDAQPSAVTTAVVGEDSHEGDVYDLQGRRLAQPRQGVNIQKGKKFVR